MIPDELRDHLGLETGTPIGIYTDGPWLMIRKLPPTSQVDEDLKPEMRAVLDRMWHDIAEGRMSLTDFFDAFSNPQE